MKNCNITGFTEKSNFFFFGGGVGKKGRIAAVIQLLPTNRRCTNTTNTKLLS